jgi:hypothetical protein
MEEVQLRNNSTRSKWVIILIQALVLLNVLYILICIWALFYNNYVFYRYQGSNLGLFTNRSFLVMEGLRNLINLFSGLTFLMWSYRANKNLRQIHPEMRFNRFLIVFAWFIPVVSWFIPYKIMRRLFTHTLEELETEEQVSQFRSVNNWWVWWLIFAAGSYAISLVQYNYNGIPNRDLDCCMVIVLMILALILCRCTIRMIRNYSALESKLYGKYAAGYASEKSEDLIDQL